MPLDKALGVYLNAEKEMKFKQNYKFVLIEDYFIKTQICHKHEISIDGFINLSTDGSLKIYAGYAWDGASGAIDNKTIIRASLIHDALYQLIREHKLDNAMRKQADEILYNACIDDGMSKFRAKYVYLAVRLFGGYFV